MTTAQGVPIIVALPPEAVGAKIRTFAVVTNQVGIAMPPIEVPCEVMTPEDAIRIFLALIETGVVGVIPPDASKSGGRILVPGG